MLTISGRALGGRKPLFSDFSVSPPKGLEEGGNLTLGELIEIIVRQEVQSFDKRQQDSQFIRVLSESAIEKKAKSGRIHSGPSEVPIQRVNLAQAVDVAHQAFEDGLFLAIVDEREYHQLEETVFLRPDSRLTFIRLVMLAGG